MLLVLNTRSFNHKKAYGLDNIIMDANLKQVARSKVDLDNVKVITRFSYDENKNVNIETFKDISVKKNIITKDFSYKDSDSGVLFLGNLTSKEVVNKTEAVKLFPEAFNKLGHFKQFTLRCYPSS